ncbi:MAG TPA: DUF397 domain-containing protein [Pseudonocardiaceae bacterium]|jgi:hypothetical protein|nr:DUF397 domain-containing protein [Pseudonocardiaceae bacterium]
MSAAGTWTTWRKSSHSGASGDDNCVEIAWRKSSYGGGGGTDCVEVAHSAELVAVRDSKNPASTSLAFSTARWRGFLASQG